MTLYLMRHGIAEDSAPSGGDPERRLTERGTLRTATVAKGLKRLGLEFDRIITSPFVRARQTAEIVARVTGYEGELLLDPRLVPFGTLEAFADLLAEHSDSRHLMLTGHEPNIGTVISGLVAESSLDIDVRKGSVTAIEVRRTRRPAAGTLLWTITPTLFERLTA